MGKAIDATGEIYNYCKAIEPTDERSPSGSVVWLFECIRCGQIFKNSLNAVKSGRVKSCGCFGKPHGDTGTRLHNIWCDMRQRCREKNNKWYGSNGITVCKEWEKSYIAFKAWALENGYNDSLSIDRIDPNGNYSPENCRWATNSEQAKNKKQTMFIYQDGKKYHVLDFLKLYKIEVSSANFGRDFRSSNISLPLYVAYRIAKSQNKIGRIRKFKNFKKDEIINLLIQEAKNLHLSMDEQEKKAGAA